MSALSNGNDRRRSIRLEKEKDKEKEIEKQKENEKEKEDVQPVNIMAMIIEDIRKLSQGPITVEEFVEGIYQRVVTHVKVHDVSLDFVFILSFILI